MTESTESAKPDALAQGFRYPPDRVTEPCLTYMARIMELRDFISFYFTFVNTSVELGKRVPESERPKSREEGSEVLKYNFSTHRQFFNEVILSRAVESFDHYVTTVLRDIFLAQPALLKSEGKLDISAVIDAGNYDDLIWQIVEKKVLDLSYSSLSDLRQFILSRTKIDLFPTPEAFAMVLIASEVRNLIAHNDCRVNEVFRRKTAGVPSDLEIPESGRIKITDEWVRRASYTLDGVVFRFDELVGEKYEVRTLNRMTSFIMRD